MTSICCSEYDRFALAIQTAITYDACNKNLHGCNTRLKRGPPSPFPECSQGFRGRSKARKLHRRGNRAVRHPCRDQPPYPRSRRVAWHATLHQDGTRGRPDRCGPTLCLAADTAVRPDCRCNPRSRGGRRRSPTQGDGRTIDCVTLACSTPWTFQRAAPRHRAVHRPDERARRLPRG